MKCYGITCTLYYDDHYYGITRTMNLPLETPKISKKFVRNKEWSLTKVFISNMLKYSMLLYLTDLFDSLSERHLCLRDISECFTAINLKFSIQFPHKPLKTSTCL